MVIESYFNGIKSANDVVKKLKDSGYYNTYVDLNENNIVNSTDIPTFTMNYNYGGYREIVNTSYKVIVDLGTNNEEIAKNIIMDMGAETINLKY